MTPSTLQGIFKFTDISEISFDIYRYYNDVLSGKNRICPYYSRLEAFYIVYVEGIGYYQLQDCPIISEGTNEHKECTAYSLEYNLTQKYLEKFSVNAGTTISIESDDIVYELATSYDPDMLYYKFEDGVYIKATIEDQYEFAEGTYYINNTRVRFYYPEKPHLSLLHRILEKAPDWSIGHVSRSLMFQERTFEIERESIYDFIRNTLCPTFKCIAVFDTINNQISFYPEDETDETGEFDSDVYISFDNFVTDMKIEYSADDIKTVLKVTGDSDLDIRTVNLGSATITDLSWFHTRERMGDVLYEKYAEYLEYCETQNERYKELWAEYEDLYSKKLILENKVPSTDFVVKIGDTFEKLYCIYYPVHEESADDTVVNEAVGIALDALIQKLKIYHLDEKTNTRTDSVLITLKKDTLSANFRVIYDNGDYIVRLTTTNPDTNNTSEYLYSLEEWVRGEIAVDNKAALLDGYSVSYIGTLGAFFCIAKDETKPTTLQEYGLNLLLTEQKKY